MRLPVNITFLVCLLGYFKKSDARHLQGEKLLENCLMENYACETLDEDDNSVVLAEFNDTSRIGCKDRCFLNPLCEHWTWWSGVDHCQLFNKCQVLEVPCEGCLTGPRSCGAFERSLSAITGGLSHDSDDLMQNKVYMIDEKNICNPPNIMNELMEMPRSRWGHVSGFIESKLIVCGGTTDVADAMEPTNTCDAFCAAKQNWTKIDSMEERRHGAVGVSLFGKLYVMGGHNGNYITNTVEVFDVMKKVWSHSPEMPLALTGHCAVAHEDSIIVMGGTLDNERQSKSVFLFNVTKGTWSELNQMKQARSGHGCSIKTRLLSHGPSVKEVIVTGGNSSGEVLASTEAFDMITMSWSAFADLPFNVVDHAQLDLGSPRIYGGLMSGADRDLIVHYTDANWKLLNVTLPQDLRYHKATKYPAYLVGC